MQKITVDILKGKFGSCSNGGVSEDNWEAELVLKGTPEEIEELIKTSELPVLVLAPCPSGRDEKIAVPARKQKDMIGPIFGGCFIEVHRPMFGGCLIERHRLGPPIRLHDRYDTVEDHERYSV